MSAERLHARRGAGTRLRERVEAARLAREEAARRERGEEGRGPHGRRQTLVSRTYGARPRPPWHPLPLSEVLILVGAAGVIMGLSRGLSHGGPPLLAGILAVCLGTVEVTLREHRSGHRSHTVMLAVLPVVIFHIAIVLVVSAFTPLPALANVGLLAVDLALFLTMFKLLRGNFLAARTRAVGRAGAPTRGR